MSKAISYPLTVTCILKTIRQKGLFDLSVYTYHYARQNSNGSTGLRHIEVALILYQLLLPRSDFSLTQERDSFLFLENLHQNAGKSHTVQRR